MRDCKATILNNRNQRGVALIMALMLLLLLTALAAALVFVANLETSVNANYRREQVLYFAGKAGIEEPTGPTWYKSTTSTIPWSPAAGATNAAALPYQWVRISLKLNGSVDNNLNSRRVSIAGAATTPVCWDGSREILKDPAAADCTKMVTLTPPGPAASPVYLVTSLAVDPTSNARRMMQAELALSPSTPFPSGMFATSSACNAVSLTGNVSTNSFDSSVSPPVYATTGATIGSNGGVSITGGAVSVGGSIETSAVTASGTPNSCPQAP